MVIDEFHVSACSFTEWYPKFSQFTFLSETLLLPPGFADFITQDGIFLPESSKAMPRRHPPDPFAVEGVDYTAWSDTNTSSNESQDSRSSAHRGVDVSQFEGYQRQIDEVIDRLGGKVLPKLNWSAPKDAWWVNSSQTMGCSTSDEVLLLLQSSDRIAHDVCHAYDPCNNTSESQSQIESSAVATSRPDLALVLRKWQILLPGREFRCFVHHRKVTGISQRDVTQRFDFLLAEKKAVQEAILKFHHQNVARQFPLENYTYDVYVTAAVTVQLIDFNPAGGSTALLLFDSWEEAGPGRLIETECTCHQCAHTVEPTDQGEEAAPSPLASSAQCSTAAPAMASDSDIGDSDDATSEASEDGSRSLLAGHSSCHEDHGGRCQHLRDHRPQVDFRIVTGAVVMRSAVGGYGVPFDFVDEGSVTAVEEFARAYQSRQQATM